jgi:hypothetical protein
MSLRELWHLTKLHARQFFTNWREYDAPLPTKLRLTLRNRLRATFSRAQCCGNPGQPGC